MFLMTILASFAFGQDACDDPCAQQPAPVAERRSWESVSSSLATAESRIDELQIALAAARGGDADMAARLDQIEAIAKQALADAQQALAGVQGNAVLIAQMRQQLDNHEARLQLLEADVADLIARMAIAEAQIARHDGEIADNTRRIADLEGVKVFVETRGAGGVGIGPVIPGVAGPANGVFDATFSLGVRAKSAEAMIGARGGVLIPNGQSLAFNMGLFYRTTTWFAVGIKGGYMDQSLGIGQDGIGDGQRLAHQRTGEIGPDGRFSLNIPSSEGKTIADLGVDIGAFFVGGNYGSVYGNNFEKRAFFGVTPSVGLSGRFYF